ncbi:UDP-glycosyltransferase 88B1 [Beta vulgaris subsp. vulgaris]|uniref:UDP-glycosyltransferase 88B1 n=1 Tax=Beta vulgaris subsp. vulgaris TaxID=3555 RepID=UPI00203742EC|nr:UDP-glycosyltransferase 88B1 [Beta vulgaris subsp. vulgaris]
MEKVILYPSPFIGHIISMVELGKLLITQSPTLSSITIIIPSSPFNNNDSYSSYISSVSSSFPSITFLFHPSIPLLLGDLSNYDDQEHITYETLRNNNNNVLESLQSISISSTITAFIIDFFCYSALEVSQSLNIPTYFFMPSGASVLAFFLNLPVYDRKFTGSFRNLDVLLEIPGLFSLPTDHMIECMLDRGVSFNEFVKLGETFLKSNGIIINTFDSLEVKAVMGLKQGGCLPGTPIPPVYCIGPLIAPRGGSNGGEGEGESERGGERHECLRWLDDQPSGSVVYLCFGSEGVFSKEQVCEIAIGLERSGVRFLWVVRAPPSENKVDVFFPSLHEPDLDSLLPEGFLDRTKDRGHVVKSWVPQIEVLGHVSIGAFVTHCGWNSTLEAVCAGLPMVAWPLYAEQKFNKILLVEEIKIALPMEESEDRFVNSNEIEKRVKQIMNSKEGDYVRKRVLEMKDKAKIALNEGGSSNVALKMLIESWQ